MSESRLLLLLLASAWVIGGVAGIVLTLTHASGTVYGLTIFTGAALGGYFSPMVLARYAKTEERKKREEIILSR